MKCEHQNVVVDMEAGLCPLVARLNLVGNSQHIGRM